ncbi:hypothetical protein BFP97_06385 [Roseivirga sp. 4D4]|uniref:helix-turn-helix domain-containing protein n=1 Tax=Roseivirga sp. 4D4 TaxID=1889784 RepID=UPI000853BB3A|nr:helix-turn-helix transcriptional regulator [Roseivirga sp. 4D4]OEK01159.1 hypothetical protein BFP97_06385 [Roseivirga sp. 4D4]
MEKDGYDKELKAIAARIRQLRIDAGFSSQDAFADTHGFQRKQIWRIEAGHNLNMTTLLRLAEIHGITIQEFFAGVK